MNKKIAKSILDPNNKLKLLSLYAWNLTNIVEYFSIGTRAATKIRNMTVAKFGHAPYSKTKVLSEKVLEQCDTNLEKETKRWKLMILNPNDQENNQHEFSK